MNIVKAPSQLDELLSKAKALLVMGHPFFAAVLLRKPIRWSDSVPTAGVNARGDIFLNPDWVESDVPTAKHMMFLLAHECMHYMLLHPTRRGWRKPVPWNIAGDKVINEILVEAGVGTFIEGGQRHEGAAKMRAEDLYDEQAANRGGGIGDDLLSGEQLTDGELSEIEAQVKLEVAQAAQAARMQGNIPGGLARIIDEILDVKTPWHQILERFMDSYRKDDLSWSRPNRRHIANNLYLPGTGYVPEMGPVVVGIDTSGSIGAAELAHFAGHINRIMEQCRPSAIHLVYCDAAVAHTEAHTCDDLPLKLVPHGGGGTAFAPVFDWVEEHGVEPDVLVYLTDGYGPFPTEPDYDTVWLITSDVVAPFGDTVRYHMEV